MRIFIPPLKHETLFTDVPGEFLLSPLQRRFVTREVCGFDKDPQPSTCYRPGRVLLVLLAKFLYGWSTYNDDQRRLLLLETKRHVYDFGEALGGGGTDSEFLLAFSDGIYVTWTGQTGFLCLADGTRRDVLDGPVLVTTAVNLTTLVQRKLPLYTRQERRQEAQDEHDRKYGEATRGMDG